MLPNTDFETDTEELTPGEAHDRWESVTNLDADGLRRLQDSERNDRYLDAAEGNQGDDDPPIPGGPLDDALHLATTPRGEWGAEERAEADEAINFMSRWRADFEQDAGEALLPEESPRIHKDEIAGMRWGFDPAPEDEFP
jgi:hypothetical protein